MKIISFIFFLALLTPFSTSAQSVVDVGFVSNGIYLSSQEYFVGSEIRAYARMRNFGDTDLVGQVGFYMGDTLLQTGQIISLPAGGFDEEVFIDFIVPSSSFNIAARIDSTTPQDQNLNNNYVQTSLFTPVFDDDRDGVDNDTDNCINNANSDQLDSDLDGIGNACDIDDDNDGLTDDVESQLGTDSTVPDSDGDGIIDPEDVEPLDPLITMTEPEPKSEHISPQQEAPAYSQESSDTTIESQSERIFSGFFNFGERETSELGTGEVQNLSPDAIFELTKINWDTFLFETTQSEIVPVNIKWNFGDGEESSDALVTHVFPGAGTYHVMLQVTDSDGNVEEGEVDVVITFFHLSNPVYLAFLVVLIVIGFLALAAMFRLKNSEEEEDEDDE